MLGIGIGLVAVGILWSMFKGWVVWDAARDPYNGGGVPTIDFPLFCPVPITAGVSLIARAWSVSPFPGFVFAVYLGLAACFWLLLWHFYRLGEPERQRGMQAAHQRPSGAESTSSLRR
jgi:hypothetical protein